MIKFFVLNYNHNSNKVEMFNIFFNTPLRDAVLKEGEKYLANPEKYKHSRQLAESETTQNIYGFAGFKEEVLSLIKWQMWGRYEYEVGVTEPFANEHSKVEKWDCFEQCKPNIECICYEIIRECKHHM